MSCLLPGEQREHRKTIKVQLTVNNGETAWGICGSLDLNLGPLDLSSIFFPHLTLYGKSLITEVPPLGGGITVQPLECE